MKLLLKIWRQKNTQSSGELKHYTVNDLNPDMSFLEMLDQLNEQLVVVDEEPVAFDHDCREGICGACSLVINGNPHGPHLGSAACQLHLRSFKDGEEIVVEPFRAKAFPVVKDLIVNREAFDRIIQAGGYISVKTGSAPEAHSLPVPRHQAEEAFKNAACIGCGACVAVCKNASASLFTAAKVSHLTLLPHGQPEAKRRAVKMVQQMEKEGFGSCTNTGACSRVCPKEISITAIARMNKEFIKSSI